MPQDLNKELNKLVATWSVLYTKLHNYHWYVTGNAFFTLHAKFEELYNEITINFDDTAERILSKGGEPVATLKEYLELSYVDEATGKETADEMVATTVSDFEKQMQAINHAMQLAAEEGDDRTEDLLNGMYLSLEKHTWMLKAFLDKKYA